MAVVEYQDVVTARLDDTMGAAAGRTMLQGGADLWFSADAAAEDLIDLVDPLVSGGDDGKVWSPELLTLWPDAESCRSLLLLRGVRVTPVMWSHRLGAWGASQSIALLDDASTLAATKAAPLSRRDAVPSLTEPDTTPAQSRQ